MTKQFQLLFGLIIALQAGSALACTKGEAGCSLEKSDWSYTMRKYLPLSICSNDLPLVKCSDVSQLQCQEMAIKAVDQCLADNDKRVPPLLNRKESIAFGEVIGDCTGNKLASNIEIKSDKDASCHEAFEPAAKPSNKSSIEQIDKMVSDTPKLTELDSKMKSLYQKIEVETMGIDGETGAFVNPVAEQQLHWENTIRNKCTSASCLETAFIKRIEQMKTDWKEALY
jgi:hypothetical protein